MDRLIFTANSSIKEQATARQMLVNELANVSTVGFKSSYDVAMVSYKAEGAGFDSRFQVQATSNDYIRMTPGPLMATGRDLDIAMGGQTVLAVQAPNGDLAFTRRGDLRVNTQGQLETGNGHLVLGQSGPISVPPGLKLNINSDGSIFGKDPLQPTNAPPIQIDQIRLRDASAVRFERREDGLFRVSGQPAGADIAATNNKAEVIPNALEGSNVSGIDALTKMMDFSRTFEMQIKMIKETKSLDESGSSMIKTQ
jgi:flagellar basal-body rod protein FlgF